MFLGELNPNECVAFLELAHAVAQADGDLAAPEAQMLALYRVEVGIPEEMYEVQGVEVEDAAAVFESDISKRAALMELMLLVMADGVAHPQEHDLLQRVQAVFALEDAQAERQFSWVQRLVALVSTGRRLVEVGDPYASVR